MGNFAKITDGKITDVIVASQEFINNLPYSSDWVEKILNIAGIGWNYDINISTFYPPQPFPSWTLNTETYFWESPIAYPTDDKNYIWNEDNQIWEEIELPI